MNRDDNEDMLQNVNLQMIFKQSIKIAEYRAHSRDVTQNESQPNIQNDEHIDGNRDDPAKEQNGETSTE